MLARRQWVGRRKKSSEFFSKGWRIDDLNSIDLWRTELGVQGSGKKDRLRTFEKEPFFDVVAIYYKTSPIESFN